MTIKSSRALGRIYHLTRSRKLANLLVSIDSALRSLEYMLASKQEQNHQQRSEEELLYNRRLDYFV